jgi:uncharacterized membrane protein
MTTKLTNAALLAAVLGAATAAQAADKVPQEKCFGITKAGENSCAAANGSHGCAGAAKTGNNGQDWKMVPKGTCEAMNGSTKPFDGENPKTKG